MKRDEWGKRRWRRRHKKKEDKVNKKRGGK